MFVSRRHPSRKAAAAPPARGERNGRGFVAAARRNLADRRNFLRLPANAKTPQSMRSKTLDRLFVYDNICLYRTQEFGLGRPPRLATFGMTRVGRATQRRKK
ncbi:hypothetical protein PLANPX_0866 [Lacipirellula parvula]|uniref:Uncharacterized protein n=1 Tax=Lacipirellula parvula TaxID=2650471 RepID=A0A5K7X3L7_9BACT|nr:hypothetical protein PLANPX_0866 [Lacipirellula parvula]